MAKEVKANKKGKKNVESINVKDNKKVKVDTENKKGKNVINNKETEKNDILVKEDKNEFRRLIKIVLIVTAIFVVFYGVTLLVTKKADEVKEEKTNETETTETTEIQYENIMIGTLLNHGGTYYVLIEEDNDVRSEEYDSLISSIKSGEDAPIIYKANLTDSFNKVYLGKEENYYVSDVSEFKVKGTTLVKVVDGKVDAAFDNYDAIKNKLSELA